MKIDQQWKLLKLIPQYPAKISSSELKKSLVMQGGRDYSLRTIQRELQSLAKVFELTFDDSTTPFAWSWKVGYGLGENLPMINLGLSEISEKAQFAGYFFKDIQAKLEKTPLSEDQTISDYDKDWFQLNATVTINQAFIQWLLICADQVEVTEPKLLRNWIANVTYNMSEYYFS